MKHRPRNTLAQVRNSVGLTQERLAKESGISVKTIQLWETAGTMNASVAKLSKVADALGVQISEILC